MRYIIGLDIGIGSTGWAVVSYDEPRRIIDFGVRMYESGESNNGKDRTSQDRRRFRSGRRLIRRRSHRKARLKAHLENIKLVKGTEVEEYLSSGKNDVMRLRLRGLDEKLSPVEIASCLIYFCNHRGYRDFYDIDDSDMDAAAKKEYESERAGAQIIDEKMAAGKYRSIADMLVNDDFFVGTGEFRRYRNRSVKDANIQINRKYLSDECAAILKTQQSYYAESLTDGNIDMIIEIIFRQRDFEDGPGMNCKDSAYRRYTSFLDTYGKCRFFPNENRGCRFTVLGDVYALINVLSQYRYTDNNGADAFTGTLACELIDHALKNGTLTKRDVKSLAEKNGASVNMSGTDSRDSLSACLKFIRPVKKIFDEYGLDWDSAIAEDWSSMDSLLNRIGVVLSQNQTPARRIKMLKAINGLTDDVIKALSSHKFSGTSNVSDKHMIGAIEAFRQGEIYGSYQAEIIKKQEVSEKPTAQYKLAPFTKDFEFYKNPVVCRSINETRKIINAIINKYGSPYAINIEVASELNRCADEREEIQKKQKDNEKDTARIRKAISELLGISESEVRPQQIERWFLGEQQGWKCLYSGRDIDKKACIDKDSKSYEVDHIIPYSLILDNTRNNKALVLASENQKKGQRAPLMYMDETAAAEFIGRVKTLFFAKKISSRKYDYLMQRQLDSELLGDWKSRNINDTRYIAKFLVSYLKNNLVFNHEGSEPYRRVDVYAVKANLTSQMRRLWLNEKTWGRDDKSKLKEITTLDHAADAVVIACCIPAYLEIAAVQNKLSGIKKRSRGAETDEYRFTMAKCLDAMRKYYGMAPAEVEPLLRKKDRTPCLIPTLREEVDIRFIEPQTYRAFGNDEAKEQSDDEIDRLFHVKCAEYYKEDTVFAASLRPVITSHKQERSVAGKITLENALSVRIIDGVEYRLRHISVLDVKKKDIGNIHSGDGQMLTELTKLMESYSDSDTVGKALKNIEKDHFETSTGRHINKVTLKETPKGKRIVKQLADGGYTVCDATSYYCIELYTTTNGKLNMRGITYSDLVVSDGKLWLAERCAAPDDYCEHRMYLYPWDYIKVINKRGEVKFHGYYVSAFNINQNLLCYAMDNTRCLPRKALSIAQTDTIEKCSIDILGKKGGEIKCGEPLLSITEKK